MPHTYSCTTMLSQFLIGLLVGLPTTLSAQEATEAVVWERVECESKREVEAYLEGYPTGVYVDEARACLERQLGLDRAGRVLVQQGLAALEYEVGTVDGLFGPVTRAALRQWQQEKGLVATGYLTRDQADTLIAQGRAVTDALIAQGRAAAAGLPREIRNSIGMELVLIEPGTFQMGSPPTEPERDADETLHPVTLSQPYYLGKYEVTQEQWQVVMGANPSGFADCGATCPVEQVSWEETLEFVEALNAREGVRTYRLPTEAEWEAAARAGTQTAYHFGAGADQFRFHGWYTDNSGDQPHPVGEQRPNAFGLFDMHGNVWEWVADWYGAYPSDPVTDPRGPSTGAYRVYRGGGWGAAAHHCRAANRTRGEPTVRLTNFGFRLARTP